MDPFNYKRLPADDNNVPDTFKHIYKYTSMEACLSILRKNTIRFKNPIEFNDPFECNLNGLFFDIKLADEDCKRDISLMIQQFPALNNNMQLINKGYRASVENKVRSCGISCFSSNANNQLMWSHYADSHKGVCIEFENIDNPFENCRVDIVGTVNYGRFPTVNYCSGKIPGIARVFLCKSKDWEYEQEIRLITLMGPNDYTYRTGFIKGITFGLRSNYDDIAEIVNLCKQKGLDIKFSKSYIRGEDLLYQNLTKS